MKCKFNAGKIVGHKLYFSMLYINTLCCFDLNTSECEVFDLFEHKNSNRIEYLYRYCLYCKDKLYLIPLEDDSVHIYDLKSGKNEYIKIGKRKNAPCCGEIFEDRLWLFPSTFDEDLIVTDINSLLSEVKPNFSIFCRNNAISEDTIKFRRIARIGSKVWLPVLKSNNLISYDLINDKVRAFTLEEKITGAFAGKDGLWLGTCSSDKLLHWDISEEKTDKTVFLSASCENSCGPEYIYEVNDKLIVLPGCGTEIHSYDLKNEKDSVIYKASESDDLAVHCSRSELYEDKIYIFPVIDDNIRIIDTKDDMVSEMPVICNAGLRDFFSENTSLFLYESFPFKLADYLRGI